MSQNDPRRNPDQRQPKRTVRDLPGCIKYIILLFLLFLLFAEIYAGEFREFPNLSQVAWLIIFFKLLLIILLIILIWVQRQLICEITSPIGCVTNAVEYDPATDRWFIRVIGTARGTAFGSYTLSTTPAIPISYPGGGSSGTVPVNNDELGRLDVTIITPGPHTITLVVSPSGAGSPCTHTYSFDWADRTTGINAIGHVEARWVGGVKRITGPSDISLPPGPPVSIGESPTVTGTADFTGCGREMIEYQLQHKIVNAGESPWPALDPGPWANILSMLQFGDPAHPRTFIHLDGSPPSPTTHYNSVRSRGNLTRVWANGPFLMPPPPPPETFASRPYTADSAWGTNPPEPDKLNGQYTVRLRVKHAATSGPPAPADIYDTATVWIDNREIQGQIWNLGIFGVPGALGVCDEILMSQFITPNAFGPAPPSGQFSKINATINGRAWDPIILDSYPHTDHPNDNFHQYIVDFKKNGTVAYVAPAIATETTRAPNILQQTPLPDLPANLALLTQWNIVAALDAGPPQAAPAPNPKIYRGERCAYIIRLRVWDKTILGDGGGPHYIDHVFPFCIMNDLPDSLVPDVVTTPWPT